MSKPYGILHNNQPWWRHQMETFSALLALCAGNSPVFFILTSHDDVIKWKNFPRYWPFVRGIHWLPVNSPHTGQWRGDLMFHLICTVTNPWANNREADYLRRHRASLWRHHNDKDRGVDPSGVEVTLTNIYPPISRTFNVLMRGLTLLPPALLYRELPSINGR